MSRTKTDVGASIDEFFNQYQLRKYPKGQVLLLHGEDAGLIYHLVSGKVKQYDVSNRGDELIVNTFKPPAFFPMSVAINKTANPYIFEAETDVEFHQAPADEVIAFLKANPEVTYDLLSRVYRGMDGLLGRITHLMTSSAKQRLLYELVVEAKRFGELQTDNSYTLHISEKDLGARAGLSRETVSREIHTLKAAGLITLHPKFITVQNLTTLEAVLNT